MEFEYHSCCLKEEWLISSKGLKKVVCYIVGRLVQIKGRNTKTTPKLHFKTLVTYGGHQCGKSLAPSLVIGNSKPYHYSIAYTLYFQKILGFLSIGRLETIFQGF